MEKTKFKDQLWVLKGKKQPLITVVQSRHTRNKPLLYFDEEKGYNRELRYATNQRSPFADEQMGSCTLGHIVFRNGKLFVEGKKPNLQKFLALHPKNNDLFELYDAVEEAQDETAWINAQLDAMNMARELDIEHLEAILRVEYGNKVSEMSSKELKRDALVFAQKQPLNFLALAKDDNVEIRNFGVKAVEAGIIELSSDNRTFKWKSNGRKLMTVPFDEHPYSALAAWFKTDEGLEIYKAIEKKIKK